VGMAFHFFMNKNATFKNKSKRYASQISVFLAIASISYLLNIGLLYVFASIVKIWYVAAQVIVICMLFLLNYLAHKYITFGLIK
jgi:putative flippase GtrA